VRLIYNDFGFATELIFFILLFQFSLWISMKLLFRAKGSTVVCYESKRVPINIFLVSIAISRKNSLQKELIIHN
jgi:hypothetical protein